MPMKNKFARTIIVFFLGTLSCCLITSVAVVVSQLHGINFQGRIAIEGNISPHKSALFLYDRIFHTLTRITSLKTSAFSPAWSPDGKRIAFISSDIDQTQPKIILLDVNTGKTETLINNGVDGFLINPNTSLAWSPDGSQILFDAMSEDCHTLFLYKLDEKTAQPLNIKFCQSKTGQAAYKIDISWFPGKVPLVGVSYESSYFSQKDDIFILDQMLAQSNWVVHGSYPIWRPGTQEFSYICPNTWTPYPNSICLYSTEQASAIKIVKNYSYDRYTWSPDGHSILFVDKGYEDGDPAILNLVNIDTGNEYYLCYLSEFNRIGYFSWYVDPWISGKAIWSLK